MSTKHVRRQRAAARADLSAVAEAGEAVTGSRVRVAGAAMAATVETGAAMAVVEAVRGAAGNRVTNQFQALDAPFIRKGELSWLEDQALLFKNAKRNSLGKRSRKTKQQSAPSGIRKKTRRGLVTWTTISITVWPTTPMKKY
jgi:hypothetical protein